MKPSTFSRREFIHTATAVGIGAVCAPIGVAAAAEAGWQIGCFTRPFDQQDYRTALDAIAESGFERCGIMTAKGKPSQIVTSESTSEEVATLAGEVKKRGLKVASIYGGDFPVAKSVDAGTAGLRRLIDHCVGLGSPSLLLGGTTDLKLHDAYYEVVKKCCNYAAEKNVGLVLKPHGGSNSTGPQCRKIIEAVGAPSFRLWYDPGNIFYYSDGHLDPVEDCASVDGLVVGMCVKDFLPPKEVMVTPGTGKVDFRKVLARLKQGGFKSGPLVIECLARGSLKENISEAKKARTFLEDLTRQV